MYEVISELHRHLKYPPLHTDNHFQLRSHLDGAAQDGQRGPRRRVDDRPRLQGPSRGGGGQLDDLLRPPSPAAAAALLILPLYLLPLPRGDLAPEPPVER